MAGRPHSGRGKAELSRISADKLDELVQVIRPHRWMGHHDDRGDRGHGHRRKIYFWIVRQVLVQTRRARVGADVADAKRMPVGSRASALPGPDRATGGGIVLHYGLVGPPLAKSIRQKPGDHVRVGARRTRDNAHDTAGIGTVSDLRVKLAIGATATKAADSPRATTENILILRPLLPG